MAMMHFLIECEEDNSLVVVPKEDLVCDIPTADTGDKVAFFFSNKKWNGQILKKSSDYQYLISERKRLLKERKDEAKLIVKSRKPTNLIVEGKRKSRSPRTFSPPSRHEAKKAKIETSKNSSSSKGKENRRSQNSSSSKSHENRGSHSTDVFEKNSSSSKGKENRRSQNSSSSKSHENRGSHSTDVFEKAAVHEDSSLELTESSSGNSSSSSTETSIENNVELAENEKSEKGEDKGPLEKKICSMPESNHQLFGKHFDGDEMVHLRDGIYCKKKEFNYATGGGGTKASHVARRLIHGVFKKQALLQCTYTGLPPRAQGKERQLQAVEPLDFGAKNAILDFAMDWAKMRNWVPQSEEKVRKEMSQVVGDIKRNLRMQQTEKSTPQQ